MRQWMSALFLCLLLVSCAQPRPQPAADEHRITRGAGEARTPVVLSRDGSTVAFAAVAPGYKNTQIWVMRADGAAPARPLTNDAAQNYDPEFSPDGRTIYFTSTREPQGIYRVPSAGGDAEMAIPNGYAARISPDGRTILYGSAGRVVKRPLAGGEPLAVLAALDNSFAPLWSPDSRRILVSTTTPLQREPEWWIVPAEGGEPVKTALGTDLRAQGFNYVATSAWLADDWIVFTGRQGETQTLWNIQLATDARTVGKAARESPRVGYCVKQGSGHTHPLPS